ncbi:cyclic nucleotide-binding/CBS domain-containing protein [Elusimicrobiota bacterium]
MRLKCPDCEHENIPGQDECESCLAPLADLVGPEAKDALREKILNHTLADIPPKKAVTVTPDATLADAVRSMRERRSCCVLVCEGGKLTGMLADRDLLLAGGSLHKDETKVRDIMHRDPMCLDDDDPVSFAFHQMAVGGYRHIPVRRDDGTLAVVRAPDLLHYLGS